MNIHSLFNIYSLCTYHVQIMKLGIVFMGQKDKIQIVFSFKGLTEKG